MDSAERLEMLTVSMREICGGDGELLDSFTLGAIRGCINRDLEDSAILDRIRDVLAARDVVRDERSTP